MRHSLAVSKLQSDNEYKKQFQETRSQFKIHADQPEFLHARKSQAQASDIRYRQHLHNYTCDPQQLNFQHAKQAYKLQSDVSGTFCVLCDIYIHRKRCEICVEPCDIKNISQNSIFINVFCKKTYIFNCIICYKTVVLFVPVTNWAWNICDLDSKCIGELMDSCKLF